MALEETVPPGARIKVIGIGGAGGNAINTMIRSNLEGVQFIATNTDIQALGSSLAPQTLQLGRELTKGLGAGADPDVGRDAALEDRHAIAEALSDSDMVFITAGMGGGTGTGGASVVAQIARELGALTVAVVTKPFDFEGKRRKRHAEGGIARLQESVDTLITIPNQRLLQLASPELTMMDAFKLADQVLVNAVKGISDIINIPGTVNVDFADVKTVMSSMGMALMGIGTSNGEKRAQDAARQAISSPLLEDIDIEGATGILINITAGTNITLMEINEACSIVQDAAHEEANIIFGAVVDESIEDSMRVTVIATGFPAESEETYGAPERTRRSEPSRLLTGFQPSSEPVAPVVPPVESEIEPELAAEPVEEPVQAQHEQEIELSRDLIEPQLSQSVEAPSLADEHPSEVQQLTEFTLGSPSPEPEAPREEPTIFTPSTEISGATQFDHPIEGDRFPAAQFDSTIEDMRSPETILDDALSLGEEVPADGDFSWTPEEEKESLPTQELTEPSQAGPLDRKIDEALDLVERLSQTADDRPQTEADEAKDDLDVPAFLRNGVKDLPPIT